MRPMTDLIPVCASSGLTGLFDDAAANIVEPAVINTSESAVFDPSIAEIGTTMRAVQAQETGPPTIVAKQHQLLAQNIHPQRRTSRRQFL
jgi:hypothetical protein